MTLWLDRLSIRVLFYLGMTSMNEGKAQGGLR